MCFYNFTVHFSILSFYFELYTSILRSTSDIVYIRQVNGRSVAAKERATVATVCPDNGRLWPETVNSRVWRHLLILHKAPLTGPYRAGFRCPNTVLCMCSPTNNLNPIAEITAHVRQTETNDNSIGDTAFPLPHLLLHFTPPSPPFFPPHSAFGLGSEHPATQAYSNEKSCDKGTTPGLARVILA
ncbi:hypothetical protein PoB_000192600 [Plakobranchus ocellatus]|uniref:Uncharacterized protein n=1 Tax=Plakobranchus ocellatus TaxID=259542 RepID=A0AAV3XX74_9GAST|nr:hypothetical protein PoB_000192600 [Plakobranchus ocellatus]